MRYLYALLISTVIIAFTPGQVFAHASLDHSQPANDAQLDTTPSSVQLWFTRALEPSFSTVSVVDQSGKQVDSGNPAVNDKDPKLLEVGVAPLSAGKYKVIWKIVALDGHKAKGEFSFTVK